MTRMETIHQAFERFILAMILVGLVAIIIERLKALIECVPL